MRRGALPFLGGLVGGYLAAHLYSNRKESTKELAKVNSNSLLRFLHGYAYLCWPELYLRIVNGALNNPDAIPKPVYESCGNYLLETHHSKILPLEEARRLIKVKEDISLTNLEHVIPFARARDVILKNPDHIAVCDCACRRIQKNPCQPLDVCISVGEPFSSFLVEHQPDHARWITKDEAVQILERERERGRFHTAWFKDAAGNRFYMICNCCSCCCLGMKGYRLFDRRVITSSGYAARVNEKVCDGCGACASVCPFEAIRVNQGNQKASVDHDYCMGCGLCVDKCTQDAIALELDPSKPAPLDVTELI